jgi:hypothetical protein
VLDLDVGPIPGTGIVARAGVSAWHCDLVEFVGNDIHECSGTAEGFNGAASGVSLGHSAASSHSWPRRFVVARNRIWQQLASPGEQASADRNGIIFDLFHGAVGGGGEFANRAHGAVYIEDNEIFNVEGRGIHLLCAGTPDSPVHINRNKIHGYYATNLGHSGPKCGIGGYGDNSTGLAIVNDNDVTPHGANPTYDFQAFRHGVSGSGNRRHGGPTGSAPASLFVD